MQPSITKMLARLMIFLLIASVLAMILSILMLGGCVTAPPGATKFDGKWTFHEAPGEPVRACLDEADAMELRKILIQCGANKQ